MIHGTTVDVLPISITSNNLGKQVVGNGTNLIMYATLGVGSLPLLEDILYIVIGNLRDDQASLSEISLVSKSLMVLARRHLFRTITVQGVSTTHGFPEFKDHLSWSQQMSRFIQDVSLVGRLDVPRRTVCKPPLDYHLLGQILSNLPSLRRLKLENVTWRGKIDRDRDDSRVHDYSPTPLDNLSITSSCVWEESEGSTGRQEVEDLLTLFSTIDTLRWNNVDIPGPGPGTNSPECQKMEIPSYLRVRSFVSTTDPYILEAISKSGSLDTLKDVSLHWYDWEDLVAVGAFLRDIGQGIQDLSFTPSRYFLQSKEMRDHQYRLYRDSL
ncbi:hypothetical protein NLI96_g616 [Meripilus lineatus]|uniref:F-box domain-containing protein n=1 Tax=Meripilus lineatus TaxID=2056292 RepID=A0AAD5VEI9_9APHY|nr:hypothetical protein NLI96_g616 [Physisporinus lineatus]